MNINDHFDSPLLLELSFNKLLEQYESMSKSDDEYLAKKAHHVLEVAEKYPILREGFSDFSLIEELKEPIKTVLSDTFSEVLTKNEIKAASVPFHNIVFNSTERFKSILKTAGKDFDLKIVNMSDEDRYIIGCTVILNFYYGFNLNFKRPFLYEIPDENGVMRYYKILYNADFVEIIKKESAPELTPEDFDQLLDHYDNLEIWKEKFPPKSYIFKGFVISNIFDVTDDQSISNIKSTLIAEGKRKDKNFMQDFEEIFRSLLKIKDLNVGFSIYNQEDDTFERVYGEGIESYLLKDLNVKQCSKALCKTSYTTLLDEHNFYSVSDVDKYYELSKGKAPQYKILKEQGIKSAILAPIASQGQLLGILELVSNKPKVLNSINTVKLIDVMPFIVSAVERSKVEEANLVEAIIQQECTSIHKSVHWKFKEAARKFISENIFQDRKTAFSKISFESVYPLYGQIDVKGSSNARNLATQKDLALQLSLVDKIIKKALRRKHMPVLEQINFQVVNYVESLKKEFKVDSEHEISMFLKNEIKPLFDLLAKNYKDLNKHINDYFDKVDDDLGIIYFYRKNYDETIRLINKNMAALLDERQVEAQNMCPHFFERFKTDGVEHNMYIGESITREDSFNVIYLYNLRLWQLQVMCEMENEYYKNQHLYPLALDVASMVLVFNQPLSIGFRMDEKQFDVDGTYNARYEVVKKRVDKACIKGTDERVTEKGKLSIVYSQKEDEEEYLRYIKFLQHKRMVGDDVEVVEIEDLQGVTGLKAIKVSILYHNTDKTDEYYKYNDLMSVIKNN